MNAFDVAAIVVTVAAASGYINHRLVRLPATTGTLVVALVCSGVVVLIDQIAPDRHIGTAIARFAGAVDFERILLQGMLCFLLFAGALNVELEALVNSRWTIIALATVGLVVSTVVVGVVTYLVFGLLKLPAPLSVCLTFGALISPTDPIAVLGLLKDLHAPRELEAQIAGESLFNDGIGVTVFLAVASMAGLSSGSHVEGGGFNAAALLAFGLREVLGGVVFGLLAGYLGYRALKTVDEHSLELLMTLALVMSLYSLSFAIHVSGPIAVVVAGLVIGNPGRRLAMSARTRDHVDAFWGMTDEILNAVLFLLLGLEVFAVHDWSAVLLPALLTVPVCLLARLVSVALPVAVIGLRRRMRRGLIPVLTWSGLRGGISVAMVLALPAFPLKDVLLASTYAVVVFSVLVQGLTVRRVLVHYGVGRQEPQ
jgi:monovalent cation:H+ antiporter, CPA1 family